MAQLSYNVDMVAALPGQLADLEHGYKLARINDSGSAVPYGIAVTQSADGRSFDLVDDASTPYFGVLVHTHRADNRTLLGAASVDDGDLCDVLLRGSINVLVESDVDCEDDVMVRVASAGVTGKQVGAFSAGVALEAESNFRHVLGARWLTPASAGQVAVLYFDFTSDVVSTLVTMLEGTEADEGSDLIGVVDTGSKFTATSLTGVLLELESRIADLENA